LHLKATKSTPEVEPECFSEIEIPACADGGKKGSRIPDNTRWEAAALKSAFQRRPDIKQPGKPSVDELTGRAIGSAQTRTQ